MAFKGLKFAHAEIRNTTASTAIKVAMIAISVIPLLYGALYLFAFLDPYEQLNTVPVAVVNEDKGAQVNGEFRVVGEDVVERLSDNDNGLGWNFVSAEEAQQGLEKGTYYMTCTIPENFTESIASADTDDPTAAQLVVEYNETKNMLASQIGRTVWKEVRQQVSDTVAQEYWETVFGKVNDGATSLENAADGAGELEDGLKSAEDGSNEITTNLATLHDGASDLTDGLGELSSGASSLQTGASTLKEGAGTLNSGAQDLADGAAKLQSGATTLANGAIGLNSGAQSLASGTKTLSNGTSSLAEGAATLSSGAKQLKNQGTSTLAAGTKQLRESTKQLPTKETVQTAQDGSTQISSGLDAVVAGLTQLKGSAEEGSGLSYAAAAAGQLSAALADTSAIDNGVAQLQGGVSQVQAGRQAAAEGLDQAQAGLSGAQQQVDGALQYLSALNTEGLDDQSKAALGKAIALLDANQGGASATITAVNAGLGQVNAGLASDGAMDMGLQQIDDGLSQLQTSASESLITASNAAGQIASGLDTAVASIGNTSTQGSLLGGLAQLQGGYSSFSAQVMPLVEQAPVLRDAIVQIDDGAAQIDSNMESIVEGSASVANGATDVNNGVTQITTGASQLYDGTATLSGGAKTLKGAIDLAADGATKLSEGSATLYGGTVQLDTGAAKLSEGAQSAFDGAGKIEDGAEKLHDGSAELTKGLKTALDGSDELAHGLADGAGSMRVSHTLEKAEVMASPVQLKDTYMSEVKNYGTGFAPYFIALGLWVGALMGTFVFKPLDKRLILSGGNPAIVAFANYMPMALLSVVQVLLLLVVLQFGLKLQIDNVVLYYAFGILTALVFAALMQMLMAAFGFPGKFISIILLMLQLTSAAGTFPIEQTPAFFQTINPYIPMTYVVSGMRQIMTGTDMGVVASSVGVLCLFGLASFFITAATAHRKRMVSMSDLHPVLQLG